MQIRRVVAIQVLDSRGNPTIRVSLTDDGGREFVAGVPAGASTGTREAKELRDGDPNRFGGRGVSRAVEHVNDEIAELVTAQAWTRLADLDDALRSLDGTTDKSRLGANAIVGVSMAAARAFAHDRREPLYRYLSSLTRTALRLPVPHFNVLNGGAHAANALDFQEFMIAPIGAPCYAEALRWGAEVYASLRSELRRVGLTSGLGDEGGFAPDIADPRRACELLVAAIGNTGLNAGSEGVALAIDPAANGFFDGSSYSLDGKEMSPSALVEFYRGLIDEFPVWSLEDGCAEGDDEGWQLLTRELGDVVQLVGDDIFVTDPETIRAAADADLANAALIKVNQIGTVSETLDALSVCRERGYAAMISHRSGETPDSFIADLAVGSGCGQIKSGAPARGERVAKYNRLLEIAAQENDVPYGLAVLRVDR
ncbi:phosphopyruvate hydratase [Williamsia maris]|uniref:Enolase n=1 Tax=Williamsia maris TaxID=72806 RepID=A0ABT1HB94_9NOCA|nr:phosphopyruvate hydratase [Williamsia maris]MCP2175434.1 enolase [Williamsia maris]